MDFYQISMKETRSGVMEIYPDWKIGRSKDLMVRGRCFYAIWDEEAGLWSTDEYDVQRIVDDDLYRYEAEVKSHGHVCLVKSMRSFNSNSWSQFRKFINHISDNSHPLDEKLTFANTQLKKTDYASRRLPYSLAPGDYSAWDELVGTLYSEEERAKIEWAIGAIVSGDSKKLQKFLVLYGPAGTGKSTILNVIEKLFTGYTASFEAKALGSSNNIFATEAFRNNPLVAIQHDGDLSRIEDNTKLNSIIAHEEMIINEKFKSSYSSRVNAFLFMGTNQPVRISDAKSGIIRRLIDVQPSGRHIPINHYNSLMMQIDFELGAIAYHCLETYHNMGKNYYNSYRPLEMMFQTDVFFNFVEAHYDIFKSQDTISLRQAYALYKEYCSETGIDKPLAQYKIREELKNYFEVFRERGISEGKEHRSVYSGFMINKLNREDNKADAFNLVMDCATSLIDREYEEQPAQYANGAGIPGKRWDIVKTTLADLDTTKLHYVKVPDNHIVIDFDLKTPSGDKSLEMNIEAASAWPPTYAELSKSGCGIHLHYVYSGDISELATIYAENIEIKTFPGNSALRRQLTKCNNIPIATLNEGLPLKEKKMLSANTIQSEKGLRAMVERNLKKEFHAGTKPSVDFIFTILEEAYESGLTYDVTDMRPKVIAFANNSSHHPMEALRTVQKMRFKSNNSSADSAAMMTPKNIVSKDDRIVFFDVEVFPNLLVVCWKYQGDDMVVKMINPTSQEIEPILGMKLVGFNNRRYDNHILYARFLGYDNEQLAVLSQKIIDGKVGAMFGEAYNLSYTDIYDFSSKKQGLKKFQIELGIHHQELPYPWGAPIDESKWDEVADYCANDVISTEKVFENRRQDFVARQILSEISGLSVNDTTQKHTAKIIFGNDRNPQESFVYTDLSTIFDGYTFDTGVSTYKGEVVGEGGYVYAKPGMYENVTVLDIASMHPTSIVELNLFGPYTKRFADLRSARLAVKHKDYITARMILGDKIGDLIESDPGSAEALAYALKIIINIVYGLTSAKFDNAFRDHRNVDNIVAKRGALFMIELRHAVQEMGFDVVHIKTDSIKIPNATPEIIQDIMEFGAKYGYDFEHEATYEKFCLINDAVYIAKNNGVWDAVGAQFQHPVVYKSLFSHEPIVFDDYCETKSVTQGALYMDFEVDAPIFMPERMRFIGRTGRFVPVSKSSGGAILYRIKDEKHYSVSGTKGYFWMEAHIAKSLGDEVDIDWTYFDKLVTNAVSAISKFGDYNLFVN